MLFPSFWLPLLLLLNFQTLILALPTTQTSLYRREPVGPGPPDQGTSSSAGPALRQNLSPPLAAFAPIGEPSHLNLWNQFTNDYRQLVGEIDVQARKPGWADHQHMLDLAVQALGVVGAFQEDFVITTSSEFGRRKDMKRGDIASELLLAIVASQKRVRLLTLLVNQPKQVSEPVIPTKELECINKNTWPGDYAAMAPQNVDKIHRGVHSGLIVEASVRAGAVQMGPPPTSSSRRKRIKEVGQPPRGHTNLNMARPLPRVFKEAKSPVAKLTRRIGHRVGRNSRTRPLRRPGWSGSAASGLKWQIPGPDNKLTNLELWKLFAAEYRWFLEEMQNEGSGGKDNENRVTQELVIMADRAVEVIRAFRMHFVKNTVGKNNSEVKDEVRFRIVEELRGQVAVAEGRASRAKSILKGAKSRPIKSQGAGRPIVRLWYVEGVDWEVWPGHFKDMDPVNSVQLNKVAV